MKYFLLQGGFWGFFLVLVSSFYVGNPPALALRDAAIGCIVGALLFRVLHASFAAGMRSVVSDRNKQGSVLVSDDETKNTKVS